MQNGHANEPGENAAINNNNLKVDQQVINQRKIVLWSKINYLISSADSDGLLCLINILPRIKFNFPFRRMLIRLRDRWTSKSKIVWSMWNRAWKRSSRTMWRHDLRPRSWRTGISWLELIDAMSSSPGSWPWFGSLVSWFATYCSCHWGLSFALLEWVQFCLIFLGMINLQLWIYLNFMNRRSSGLLSLSHSLAAYQVSVCEVGSTIRFRWSALEL